VIDPPIYPTHLVRCKQHSKDELGNARFVAMGWTFLFTNGSLRVSEPAGVNVIDLGPVDTERFIDVVRALDQGRFAMNEWELVA